jgi:hypothetical protein
MSVPALVRGAGQQQPTTSNSLGDLLPEVLCALDSEHMLGVGHVSLSKIRHVSVLAKRPTDCRRSVTRAYS